MAARSDSSGYGSGAFAVASMAVLGILAGIASLWLLNRILTKEAFGAYAFTMNAVFLLAIVGTMGLDRIILLRIAGLGGKPGVLRGTGLLLRAAASAALAGLVLAGLLAALSIFLAKAGARAETAVWLASLSLAVPLVAVTSLARAWFQANHRTAFAVILPGLSDLARAALIAVAALAALGGQGVAAAVILGAFVPLAVAVLKARQLACRRAPRRLTPADFGGGALFMLQDLSVAGLRYLDLLVLGLLSTGAITADYAMASRLAAMADLGRLSLKPTFTPRVRRHLVRGDAAAVSREFHALRLAGLLFALLAAAALALAGKPVLAFFGPFEAAYGPLLVLLAGHIVAAGTGMHSSYLAMSGEVRWSAVIRVGSLALLVALVALAAPRFGALGAAFAMLAVQCVANLLSLHLLRGRTGFRSLPAAQALPLAAAVGALAAGALGLISPALLAAGLLALAAVAVALERGAALDLAGLVNPGPKNPAP